jgi:hypothetical protein
VTLSGDTPGFATYIQARDEDTCQVQDHGCTGACDTIIQRLSDKDLAALRRDPNSPDNWCCACTNCATQQEGS